MDGEGIVTRRPPNDDDDHPLPSFEVLFLAVTTYVFTGVLLAVVLYGGVVAAAAVLLGVAG